MTDIMNIDTYGVPNEEVLRYREVFECFDHDGDGNIYTKQFKTVLELLKIHMTDEEMRDLVNNLDQDAPGLIDFREFLYMMSLHAKRSATAA